MPRKADARLEGRILDAAYRMWSKRGEHALTMRAVASASGTTTPTLYERFSNKDDLLSLLRHRARLNLFSAIKSSRSSRKLAAAFSTSLLPIPTTSASSPKTGPGLRPQRTHAFVRILEAATGRRTWREAGSSHAGGSLLVALLHGTSTLLHSVDIHKKTSRDFRSACISACEALIQAASAKAARSNGVPRRRREPLHNR